jgi:hypothetical protein
MRARLAARALVVGPAGAIGSGVMAIGELAAGMPVPRVLQFAWPAVMIVWAVLVLVVTRCREMDRATIKVQRAVIRQFTEMTHEIFRDG